MKNSQKILVEWFKPFFDKHPRFTSFFFNIYGEEICLSEEDCGINGVRWDKLADRPMMESSYQIQKAIEQLKKCTVPGVEESIKQLEELVTTLQTDAEAANPLSAVFYDIWSEENRKKLTKKVQSSLKKEIPWKYVDYVSCEITRDSVTLDEMQIRN